MTIVNQAGCDLFIDGNEIEPQEEYDTSEMMFNTQSIFSDVGAIEITTEYSQRSFRCFGNLEAYENKEAKDKQGLPVIVIISKESAPGQEG